MNIMECDGYKKLLMAVERDEKESPGFHDYRGKLAWVIERANHYAEKTGLDASAIIDKWEGLRTYWYMNYYQDSQQPLLTNERIRIFETQADLLSSIEADKHFRCPFCNGVSSSPYKCNSGIIVDTIKGKNGKNKVCDWKSYGLFGDLGKGIFVFIKDKMIGQTIFMPLLWESDFPIARP